MKLHLVMPLFAAELRNLLPASDLPVLADQVDELELVGRCRCGEYFCSSFYVNGGSSPLDDQEQALRGRYSHNSLYLGAPSGLVVVDTDHLDRIVFVEVQNRPDVEEELASAIKRDSH